MHGMFIRYYNLHYNYLFHLYRGMMVVDIFMKVVLRINPDKYKRPILVFVLGAPIISCIGMLSTGVTGYTKGEIFCFTVKNAHGYDTIFIFLNWRWWQFVGCVYLPLCCTRHYSG